MKVKFIILCVLIMTSFSKLKGIIQTQPLRMVGNNKLKVFVNEPIKVTSVTNDPITGVSKKVTTAQVGKSIIQQETVQYTIPSVPVDSAHRINSYYPLFYKTHLLEYNETLNTREITNLCSNLNCEWCLIANNAICRQCKVGYFFFDNSCVALCPLNHSADIFRRTCNPLEPKNTLAQITYLKAFSIGSCRNMCGNQSSDCSCLSNCILEGNCCSDYSICENLITRRLTDCQILNPTCELCETIPNKCGKCFDTYWNREGQCVPVCENGDLVMTSNKLCLPPKQDCRVENCSMCMNKNPSVCRTCSNGFFMYNNQCLLSCPFGLVADRISWTCLEPPVFAWYWIFPSKVSCRSNCGKYDRTLGCSCHNDCLRYGNCCQDIDDFCPQFIYWK